VAASTNLVFPLDLALDKKRLWARLAIDGSRVRRTLDWFALLDRLAAEARGLIEARAAFAVVSPDDLVELLGLGRSRLPAGATKVAVCALTLGGRLEERSNALAIAGDYAEAGVLSIIGDCALAEAQERVRAAAGREAGPELTSGVVLQPGARYWGIEANRVFERLLPLDALGVRILESFALSPSKSKTFAAVFTRAPRRDVTA
jgi:hypothetical protein